MWTINRDIFTRSLKRKLHRVGASLFVWGVLMVTIALVGYIGSTAWMAWLDWANN